MATDLDEDIESLQLENRFTDVCLVIEDEATRRQVAERMKAAGMLVIPCKERHGEATLDGEEAPEDRRR